jgi:hypothetical protein
VVAKKRSQTNPISRQNTEHRIQECVLRERI